MLCTIFLLAQAPQAFNYQGVARDLAGNPVTNQTIGLRISILENNATGPKIYQEIHLIATSDLGLFTIQIGAGSTIVGSFEDIDWGIDHHFLQIEMDESGGSNYQLIGTSQLLSVPYALYAENGSRWEAFETITSGDTLSGIRYESKDSRFELMHQAEDIGLSFPHLKLTEFYDNGTKGMASINLIKRSSYNDHPTLEFAFAGSQGFNRNFSWRVFGNSKMFLKGNGYLGLGTTEPKAKIHVAHGDVFMENKNNGIIMKSPNGQCWRLRVNDSGGLYSTAIVCPN